MVLLNSELIEDPRFVNALASKFMLLGSYSIENSSNSDISFPTFLKVIDIFMSFTVYLPLIWLTTS